MFALSSPGDAEDSECDEAGEINRFFLRPKTCPNCRRDHRTGILCSLQARPGRYDHQHHNGMRTPRADECIFVQKILIDVERKSFNEFKRI